MDKDNVDIIREKKLCIACGVCVPACPVDVITIEKDETNYYPKIHEGCIHCSLCMPVCPSLEVDLDLDVNEKPIGDYIKCYTGWSTNPDQRKVSSSGGIAAEFKKYLLNNDIVDLVIAVDKNLEKDCQTSEITVEENDTDLQNSMYVPVNFSVAIRKIRSNLDKRIAVIGVPCQISGVKNLEKTLSLKHPIFYIGLFCGYSYNFNTLKLLKKYYKIDDIKHIEYRHGGWPGEIRVNKEREINRHPQMRKEPLNYLKMKAIYNKSNYQERCLRCLDHINYTADIAIGDAWLKRFADNKEGVNLFITRSQKADDIIGRMHEEKIIEIAEASEQDVVEAQSEDYVYSLSAQKYRHFNQETLPEYKKFVPKKFTITARDKRFHKRIMLFKKINRYPLLNLTVTSVFTIWDFGRTLVADIWRKTVSKKIKNPA